MQQDVLSRMFKQLAYIQVTKSLLLTILVLFAGSSLAQDNSESPFIEIDDLIGSILMTDSFDRTFRNNTSNLSVGFIHLKAQSDILISETTASENETKVTITNLVTDAWDYAEKGFEISVSSKSNPYAVDSQNDTSVDLWFSTSYFQDLDSIIGTSLSETLGLSGFTEVSLQAEYRPSLLPLSTTSSTTVSTSSNILAPLSASGSISYRQSFDANISILNGPVSLERITLEPEVQASYDTDLNFGADLAIRADTNIYDFSNLIFGLEGGYTNGFWYSFTINSPIKF